MLVPSDPVAFIDDAWVVANNYDSGPGGNRAAYSTSWYAPAGMANDWLIIPQVTLGADTRVSWRSRTQDPAGFLATPPIFSIASEAAGEDYDIAVVDL